MADGFLGRWSRRKQDVLAGKVVAEPPAPALAPTPAPQGSAARLSDPTGHAAPPLGTSDAKLRNTQGPATVDAHADEASAPPPPPTLADAQALTANSDFKPFVSRAVSPEIRNLAMKKLFADPHFNVMDGLDIYIGDYSQPDPLSPETLRQMASAHALGFFDHEKEATDVAGSGPVPADSQAQAALAGDTMAPVNGQPRDDAETDVPQDVAQSRVCTAVPSGAPSELISKPGGAPPSVPEAVARPASHTDHDNDAHLRLQPDDAPQRESAGRGTA